eukprot:7527669-Lingulodinium_polyedra.AAC.1
MRRLQARHRGVASMPATARLRQARGQKGASPQLANGRKSWRAAETAKSSACAWPAGNVETSRGPQA